jgi:hypothetical protein
MDKWEMVNFKDQEKLEIASFNMFPLKDCRGFDQNLVMVLGGWQPNV